MMTWPSADRAVTHRHDYETILSPEGLETVYWTQTCLVCGTPASDLLMARSSAPRVGSCCGDDPASSCASDADTTSVAATLTDYATPVDELARGLLGEASSHALTSTDAYWVTATEYEYGPVTFRVVEYSDACPVCGDVDTPCCCDTEDSRACDAGSCDCE